jgi:hypothetical protein
MERGQTALASCLQESQVSISILYHLKLAGWESGGRGHSVHSFMSKQAPHQEVGKCPWSLGKNWSPRG